MVSLMDRYIGRILDKLDELGLTEDTLVVFTSDHGNFYGHHGIVAKGAFHYEDLIRVPFIVRPPGRVPAGRRSNALTPHRTGAILLPSPESNFLSVKLQAANIAETVSIGTKRGWL